MSVVEGFGGMRVIDGKLSFEPKVPDAWDGFSFKINFRNQILKVSIKKGENTFSLDGGDDLAILVNGKEVSVSSEGVTTI